MVPKGPRLLSLTGERPLSRPGELLLAVQLVELLSCTGGEGLAASVSKLWEPGGDVVTLNGFEVSKMVSVTVHKRVHAFKKRVCTIGTGEHL